MSRSPSKLSTHSDGSEAAEGIDEVPCKERVTKRKLSEHDAAADSSYKRPDKRKKAHTKLGQGVDISTPRQTRAAKNKMGSKRTRSNKGR